MSDEKLIFPKNWDKKKKKQKHWKKPEVQENICPKCNCYTQRFSGDGCCQFCGYEVEEFQQRPEIDDMEEYVREMAEELLELSRYGRVPVFDNKVAEKFITQIISDVRGGKAMEKKSG